MNNNSSIPFYSMPTVNNIGKQVVVLADGLFPSHLLAISTLKTAKTIICCDGAATKLVNAGMEPDYIVGDLDSLSDKLKVKYADRLYPSSCQETNDLTKAVSFCIEKGWTDLYIVGATGLREDHALANISLLADYAERANVTMLTDTGVFNPILSTSEFESIKEQQVSIFSLTPGSPIYLSGLKYPLDRCVSSWWQGTLNEATDSSFSIKFEQGRLLVFRQYC